MKAIVVADKNWAIGREDRLLAHLPGDLNYFKEKTMGHTLIMGRATVESLPKKQALPGRTTIVLSRSGEALDYGENARLCHSLAEVKALLGDLHASDAYCAGGASVYEQLLPYCDEVLVTVMEQSFAADRYFPDLPKLGWKLASESEPCEENGITYRFCVYRRP